MPQDFRQLQIAQHPLSVYPGTDDQEVAPVESGITVLWRGRGWWLEVWWVRDEPQGVGHAGHCIEHTFEIAESCLGAFSARLQAARMPLAAFTVSAAAWGSADHGTMQSAGEFAPSPSPNAHSPDDGVVVGPVGRSSVERWAQASSSAISCLSCWR